MALACIRSSLAHKHSEASADQRATGHERQSQRRKQLSDVGLQHGPSLERGLGLGGSLSVRLCTWGGRVTELALGSVARPCVELHDA